MRIYSCGLAAIRFEGNNICVKSSTCMIEAFNKQEAEFYARSTLLKKIILRVINGQDIHLLYQIRLIF